jgi:hypothetical protein
MDEFKAKRIFVSHTQLIKTAPEKVFPLLCPTKEYYWIETWKCELIYSESGFAEQDCIFVTGLPGDERRTWFVDEYEKNKYIQFIIFSNNYIIRYKITLTGKTDNTTGAEWAQTITALNANGNKYIEEFSISGFKAMIERLERMMNYYLETGNVLKEK